MSIVLQSSGGGSVTLQEAVTASNLTITVPAVTGTMAIQGPSFFVWLRNGNNNYSVTSNTETIVPLDTEIYDTDNAFDTSTYRFTPQVAGYYQIIAMVRFIGTSITEVYAFVNKNGSNFFRFLQSSSSISPCHYTGSCIVYLNGSTDYITLSGQITATSPSFGVNGATSSCSLSGALVRAA